MGSQFAKQLPQTTRLSRSTKNKHTLQKYYHIFVRVHKEVCGGKKKKTLAKKKEYCSFWSLVVLKRRTKKMFWKLVFCCSSIGYWFDRHHGRSHTAEMCLKVDTSTVLSITIIWLSVNVKPMYILVLDCCHGLVIREIVLLLILKSLLLASLGGERNQFSPLFKKPWLSTDKLCFIL